MRVESIKRWKSEQLQPTETEEGCEKKRKRESSFPSSAY
jgi:hypothetical protein